jgi:hypothetical protein
MKSFIALSAIVAAVSASIALGAEPKDFRFWKEIDRGSANGEDIASFLLDADIYAATRDGFPDLRIYDDKKTEVPCLIETSVEYEYSEEKVRETFSTTVESLHEEGDTLEVLLETTKTSPDVDGLIFSTPLVNFEKKVRVFGSEDGKNWTLLAENGVLFDYSRLMDVRNVEVPLANNHFHRFKVVVENVTDEKESPNKELTRTLHKGEESQRVEKTQIERRTLRIDKIGAWHIATREKVKREKPTVHAVAAFSIQQDPDKKQTVVTVRTHREPLTSFSLETSSRNFSRRVVVESPEIRKQKTAWTPLGKAVLSNVSFRSYRDDRTTVAFSEHRYEEYRIIIDNGEYPPLENIVVKATGKAYRAVFLAEGAKSYRVGYGSGTIDSAKEGDAAALAKLRNNFRPIEVQLGPQKENPSGSGEPQFQVGKLLNNWIFLGTAIVLMVAVLGWGLYRAGRQLEEIPKE